MRVLPPKDIAPPRLFRLLSESPRPALPTAHRIRGAEDVQLSVVALTAREWSDSTGFEEELEIVRPGRACGEILSRALLADGVPAFASYDQALELPEEDLAPLIGAVIACLDRMGPPAWRRDEAEWNRVLRQGASHWSNSTDVFALGTSYEVGGSRILDRPERFYGVPVRDLTDGQWLAYRVARTLVDEANR